jgi:hypothetical protein
MLKSYLKSIYEISNRGDAREESYYSTLEGLLREYTESVGKKKIHITTLPKKTEAGNPDFRIWDGKQHIVGYLEAKAPTVDNLKPAIPILGSGTENNISLDILRPRHQQLII